MRNISTFCAISVPVFVIVMIVMLAVGIIAGIVINIVISNKKLNNTKNQATKILEDAYAQAKSIKLEQVNKTNEEINILKSSFERENQERREQFSKSEERLTLREQNLIKKEEVLEKKTENLEQMKELLRAKEQEVIKRGEDIESERKKIDEKLVEISSMTVDEAKQVIIDKYTDEAKLRAAKIARNIEENAVMDANKKAKQILTLAIQKCAADHTSEVTVSSVSLPNEEMKGRIIGREGRNIRALEMSTGVDFIIDDTPETIVISAFDPIRREVARIALEKLMLDGRINPARIEELVEKVRRDLDNTMKEAGENACFDADIHNMHPELIKILGRLKYRTSYGQNVLNHSLEVCYIAGLLAAEVGADIKLAKRGGLLHDIGKALDHEIEGTHVSIGVDLCKKYRESEAVTHIVASHHNDIEPQSIEAVLVQAADAISSSRPGARRESLENYIKRLENLENIANSFDGIEKSFALQAGREIRIMVKPEQISDDRAVLLSQEIASKIEKEMDYPGQIRVNVIRETRFTSTAK